MNMKKLPLALAVAILLGVGGQVLARHVTHPVTPANVDEQPFSFTVQVKDVGELKEFEITVKQKAGKSAPVGSATGSVVIDACGKKEAAFPAITRVQSDGVQTYTFRLSPSDLDRAHLTFTETPQDVRTPFPSPGDYWVFDLSNFVGNPKK
jgi:hypothetical protein